MASVSPLGHSTDDTNNLGGLAFPFVSVHASQVLKTQFEY